MAKRILADAQLQVIVDTMAEGLFVLDGDGVVILWNLRMEELTGRPAAEILGKTCKDVGALCGTPDDRERCALFLSGDVEGYECALRHRSGEVIPVMRNTRVLRNSRGQRAGAVATIADLRPLRQAQIELELAQARLEKTLVSGADDRPLLGESREIRELNALILKAASSDVTVLIEGETGTGKELVAQAIHRASSRRDGPFVTVNCSALATGLLESELFGHVRGAFTGAIVDRLGRFEAAAGGTILLDEVGELAPAVQAKLLRVLQERTVERLGETRSRPIDVRVLAATNRSLADAVEAGHFRQDLYFRLKVFTVHTVPLRQRRADILLLAEHFLKRFRRLGTGRGRRQFSPAAKRLLFEHEWPGNVRELENAIQHAYVLAGTDPKITPAHLPEEMRRPRQSKRTKETGPRCEISVSRLTADELQVLLDETRGNLAAIARRLGVHRSTVWRRLRALGLPTRVEDS